MYAKATFLSQRHQFLFMYKCINHNIIVRFKIFLIFVWKQQISWTEKTKVH